MQMKENRIVTTRIKARFNAVEASQLTSFSQNSKVVSTLSAGKVMLTVLWDPQGALLAHFQKCGEKVNCASHEYYEVLVKLRDAIRRKRPDQLAKRILLHHNNARPQTTRATQRIKKTQWELTEHPPYSSDLAPSDVHLFDPLKSTLVAHVSLMTKSSKQM
jgi:histone-lysine N-methyltransferase SETMAR